MGSYYHVYIEKLFVYEYNVNIYVYKKKIKRRLAYPSNIHTCIRIIIVESLLFVGHHFQWVQRLAESWNAMSKKASFR